MRFPNIQSSPDFLGGLDEQVAVLEQLEAEGGVFGLKVDFVFDGVGGVEELDGVAVVLQLPGALFGAVGAPEVALGVLEIEHIAGGGEARVAGDGGTVGDLAGVLGPAVGDPEARAAELCTQPLHRLERRRQVRQAQARETRQARGKIAHHRKARAWAAMSGARSHVMQKLPPGMISIRACGHFVCSMWRWRP